MFYNDFNRNNNIYFSEDIDNIQSIDKIDNIMVGSTTRENLTTNGIIHLYNSLNPIQTTQKKRFDAISRFLGQCIQNSEDLMKKLTQTVAVMLDSGPSYDQVNKSVEIVGASKNNWEQLTKPIMNMDMIVKQNISISNKIEEEVSKYGPE